MAQYNQPRTQHGSQDRRHEQSPAPNNSVLLGRIRFTAPLDPELFNDIAHDAAKWVAFADKERNKGTQLRRFYDELVLWETRVSQHPEKFDEHLPFIRMLNAKVAYAEGRKLVDRTFVDLMHHTLGKVTNATELSACKNFWEAFMGFYKLEHRE